MRWNKFTSSVTAAVKAGQQYDAKAFYDMITEAEYQWTLQSKDYPLVSGESPFVVAQELFNKYKHYFD